MKESDFEVWHFYEGGRILRQPFKRTEYDLLLKFIAGLRLCGTDYRVFKGNDLFNVETGEIWDPFRAIIA